MAMKKQKNNNRSAGRETAGCVKLVFDREAQCLGGYRAKTVRVDFVIENNILNWIENKTGNMSFT